MHSNDYSLHMFENVLLPKSILFWVWHFFQEERGTNLETKGKKLFVCVLVSSGCHNKLPQIGWVKATEIYPVRGLEARNLRLKFWQYLVPSNSSREESFLASSSSGGCQQSLPFFGLKLYESNLCHHMAFFLACASVSQSPSPFSCKDTTHCI